MKSAPVQTQAIVVLDACLMWLGVAKSCVGLLAVAWIGARWALGNGALPEGAWVYATLPLVFSVAALMLRHDLYWPSFLALTGAAFVDWPARHAWGVELSSYPLLSVQALVAVPLWLAAMDYYPRPLEGRARLAAIVCCWTAFIAGWAAPFLVPGAYWFVVAPLGLVALGVLLYRMKKAKVKVGTRGWVCCVATIPIALGVSLEVLVPSLEPYLWKVVPWAQLCLGLGPVALIALYLGGKRHDGKGASGDRGAGPKRRRVLGWAGVHRGGGGGLHELLPSLSGAAAPAPATLRGSVAGHGAEALQDGRVVAGRWPHHDREVPRREDRGQSGDGRHDLLRPATAEVVDLVEVGTGPLLPEKVAR